MSWTTPKTWAVGDTLTSPDMNQYVRDNLAFLAGTKSATVATNQSTASTAYTDLATAGPAVTVVTGANALVFIGCNQSDSTVGSATFMGFAVSGATTIAATDNSAAAAAAGIGGQGFQFANVVSTTVNPGSNTFTAKYRVNGGTGTFVLRWIAVIPLP